MKTCLTALMLISMPTLSVFARTGISAEELSGEWLNRCVIAWMKDIRAGVRGGGACSSTEVLFIFRKDNLHLRETASLNEGSDPIPILAIKPLKDDSYVWTLGVGPDGERRPDEQIRAISRTRTGIREIEWEKQRFIKSGPYTGQRRSISRYLNKLILAGKYKDQKGRLVTFTDDEFIYPDNADYRSFKYEVEPVVPFDAVSEYPPGRYTFLVVETGGNTASGMNDLPMRMGFEWKHGKLYLYPVNWTPPSGEGIVVLGEKIKVSDEKMAHSTNPLFILTPIKTGP